MSQDDLFQVQRPEVGRPTDRRVDSEFLAGRPELRGLRPFDPTRDVDLTDEINRVAANLRAEIASKAVSTPAWAISSTTDNPRAPEQEELDANEVLHGSRLTASGAVQPLTWEPHTRMGQWVERGEPTATVADVQATQEVAAEAKTAADTAKSVADTAQETAAAAAAQLVGVTNQAALGAPPVGVSGMIERPANMMTYSDTQRVERVTYGITENAVIHAVSNMPGGRSQITGILTMGQLAQYHSFDHVSAFAEFSAEPGLYDLPAGNGTFSPDSVVVDLATHFPRLRPGMFVFVRPDAEGEEGWYGDVLSWDAATRKIVVGGWYNFIHYGPRSGAKETPPNGRFCVINPLSKAWVDNRNLLLPPGGPAIPGVIAEWGLMNNRGDNAQLNGLDLVSLGSKTVGSAVVVRSAKFEGSWAYGVDVMGAREAGIYIRPDHTGIRPKIDVAAVAGTEVGFYSAGGKARHAQFISSTGDVAFDVEDNGMVNSDQGYVARGKGNRKPYVAYLDGEEKFSVGNDGSVNTPIIRSNGAEILGYIDLHQGDDGKDFGARLVTDGNGLLVQGQDGNGYVVAQRFIGATTPTTPANSADPQGFAGAMTWDDNYLYVKTAAGWKRSAMTAF